MSLMTGKVGAIYKQDDSELTVITNTASTLGVDNKTLTITDNTCRYLSKTNLVVKKDTVALSPTLYEIMVGGVKFYDEQTAGTYTIEGFYYEIEKIGGFFSYSLDSTTNIEDVTEFGDVDEKCIATTNTWSASAEYFYKDDSTQQQDLATYMNDQTEIIFIFYWDTVNDLRQEGYGRITNINVTTDMKGVTKGKIEFTGNGKLTILPS